MPDKKSEANMLPYLWSFKFDDQYQICIADGFFFLAKTQPVKSHAGKKSQ